MTRLYYYPDNLNNKSNFAYFVHTVHLDLEKETNVQRCVVNIEQPEKLELFKLSGKSLRPLEAEAAKIVAYLNKGYNVRIQEIVLDFMRDEAETLWLLGCKGLKIDPSTLKAALKPVESWWAELHLADPVCRPRKSAKTKELLNYVQCRLCRVNHHKHQISNMTSVRMIVLLTEHMQKRTQVPWDVTMINFATKDMLSQSVRVCQLCYMMLTSEYELMKAEEQLAEVLSIPLHER